MSTIKTMFTSTDMAPAARNKLSFASAIAKYQPNGTAKLVALTSMLKRETAVNTTHGYYAKTMVFPTMTLGAAIANGTDTSITVVSTAAIVPGMVMRVASTLEQIRVTSITSSTVFVGQRSFGTVAGAAVSNSVVLYQIGTAYEEASNRPDPYAIDAVAVSNYTQIFRNAWAVSGSAAAVQVIAGSPPQTENKADCMAMHARDMEFMALFGQKKSTTHPTNGKAIRASEGVYGNLQSNSLTNNIVTLGSTTTYTQLENALDVCFDTAVDGMASSERVLFVGGLARRVINNIGRLNSDGSGWSVTSGETSFGLQFDTFKCARGTFNMIEHPLLNAYGPTAPQAASAIALHLPTFNFAYLGGRDTQAEDYGLGGSVNQATVEGSGVDAMGGSLTSECCAVFKNPSANAIIGNFTAAAVG